MDAQAADVSGGADEPRRPRPRGRSTPSAALADEMGTPVRLVTPGRPRRGRGRLPPHRAASCGTCSRNAIEHGDGRPIVVTVDSSATAVGLGVRDHGAGMPQHHADRVFDRFWRADPSRQRRIGGTGLGLAISLEDALLHGGSLEVWSREGDGTNFVLTLPRDAGRADDRPTRAARAVRRVPLHGSTRRLHRPPTGRIPVVRR